MKISAIKEIQNEVLIRYDKDRVCATCCLFHNSNKERYQKLLEFYYMLSRNEMDQITYYRLFMLEIFKDVVKNGKI